MLPLLFLTLMGIEIFLLKVLDLKISLIFTDELCSNSLSLVILFFRGNKKGHLESSYKEKIIFFHFPRAIKITKHSSLEVLDSWQRLRMIDPRHMCIISLIFRDDCSNSLSLIILFFRRSEKDIWMEYKVQINFSISQEL